MSKGRSNKRKRSAAKSLTFKAAMRRKLRQQVRDIIPSPKQAPNEKLNHLRTIVLDMNFLQQILLLTLLFGVLWMAKGMLLTLLFAFVIAFLGSPMVDFLEEKKWSRSFAAGLYLGMISAVITLLTFLVLPTLIKQVIDLIDKIPLALEHLETWLDNRVSFKIPHSFSELSAEFSKDAISKITGLLQNNSESMGKGIGQILSLVISAAGATGQAFLVPVLAFFLLVELPEVYKFVFSLVPSSNKKKVHRLFFSLRKALIALVRGQFIVASILATIYSIGLSISGVPLALAIGIISGVGYIIPFASLSLCLILSTIFILLDPEISFLFPFVGALLTGIFIQMLEGWVLTPRIIGEKVGLSPFAVILSVLFFGTAFGFVGILFSLPLSASIAVILADRNKVELS